MDPLETPGATLSQTRQAQGISVEELAAITRISPRQIRSLEDDRYEDLPAGVFVRGFLRSCARELKLDDADLIAGYERLTGSRPTQSKLPERVVEADHAVDSLFEPRRSLHASYIIAILAIILGLSLSLLIFGSSEPDQLTGSHRDSDESYPLSVPSNPN